MDRSFYTDNRRRLAAALPEGALAVLFAGEAPRQSADAYYPFYASRNYLYLAGVDFEGLVLTVKKTSDGIQERLYIPPKDAHAERWNGRRYSADEAHIFSGVEDIRLIEAFEDDILTEIHSGSVGSLWLDLFKKRQEEPDDNAHRFAAKMKGVHPWLTVENLLPHLRRLRTIKASCEIEAMKRAEDVTKAGIVAMMQACRPGMREYELKAAFDCALTKNGVLTPAFPPIVSAGENNFCIHYNSYIGEVRDGDMVLNDVGAQWDHLATDVSRGWPANGRYSKEQGALYTAAYNTSNYMFSVIKPGMPMEAVDETVKKTLFEELKKIGLLQSYDDIGRYVWHGGAHHVGFDVHDVVAQDIKNIAPGMVFCVDVGIYCEAWGIGFRLEDNCLVTQSGCVNLSANIPRSIDEIEGVMGGK